MASYRFITYWLVRTPIDRAWEAIVDAESWPSWWPGVVSVDLLRPGDESGIGSVRRFVWRSKLPYTLAFDMEVTRVEAPVLLAGRASGELAGTGVWELAESAGVTTLRYTWIVRTTRPWMSLLAPIARPLFAWNHDYVMNNGARSLARLLDAELVSVGKEL